LKARTRDDESLDGNNTKPPTLAPRGNDPNAVSSWSSSASDVKSALEVKNTNVDVIATELDHGSTFPPVSVGLPPNDDTPKSLTGTSADAIVDEGVAAAGDVSAFASGKGTTVGLPPMKNPPTGADASPPGAIALNGNSKDGAMASKEDTFTSPKNLYSISTSKTPSKPPTSTLPGKTRPTTKPHSARPSIDAVDSLARVNPSVIDGAPGLGAGVDDIAAETPRVPTGATRPIDAHTDPTAPRSEGITNPTDTPSSKYSSSGGVTRYASKAMEIVDVAGIAVGTDAPAFTTPATATVAVGNALGTEADPSTSSKKLYAEIAGTGVSASTTHATATVAGGLTMPLKSNASTDTSPAPKNLYSIFSKTPSKAPALTALGKTRPAPTQPPTDEATGTPSVIDLDSSAGLATDALAAEMLDATDGAFTTVADAIEAGLDSIAPSGFDPNAPPTSDTSPVECLTGRKPGFQPASKAQLSMHIQDPTSTKAAPTSADVAPVDRAGSATSVDGPLLWTGRALPLLQL